jgi:hypothetical protein
MLCLCLILCFTVLIPWRIESIQSSHNGRTLASSMDVWIPLVPNGATAVVPPGIVVDQPVHALVVVAYAGDVLGRRLAAASGHPPPSMVKSATTGTTPAAFLRRNASLSRSTDEKLYHAFSTIMA